MKKTAATPATISAIAGSTIRSIHPADTRASLVPVRHVAVLGPISFASPTLVVLGKAAAHHPFPAGESR
jgi:hypothetical protein